MGHQDLIRVIEEPLQRGGAICLSHKKTWEQLEHEQLCPSWPAALGLEARAYQCQTVFSLKPDERFTISVIFRRDSLAHLSPTPLCAEVQKLKPSPWPQERFRGEAPYREPLQSDTLARMELTGKAT